MTQIKPDQFKRFLLNTIGTNLDRNEAKKLGVTKEYTEVAEELDTNNIDIDDVIADKDLYEQFATLFVAEQDKKTDTKDKEKEKEKQKRVEDKNQAGV